MSRRRVLVLGAGGFIGQRIVAGLQATDWAEPIAGLHRPDHHLPAVVEQRIIDATSAAALTEALADVDGIVNSIAGDASVIVANARALSAVLPALMRRPRVVHLSTMSVYGKARGVVGEGVPLTAPVGDYGRAKRSAEAAIAPGGDVVVLRPGIVYGPGSPLWSRLIGQLLLAGRLGDLGAAGAGVCNLVHVDDVAAAVVAALVTPQAGGRAYNLVIDEPPSWNGYFAAYGQALGLSAPVTIGPVRLAAELRLVGPWLKLGERLGRTRLPPAIRPWLIDQCADDLRLDGRRAADDLGLRQRTLEAGLAETARWLRESLRA